MADDEATAHLEREREGPLLALLWCVLAAAAAFAVPMVVGPWLAAPPAVLEDASSHAWLQSAGRAVSVRPPKQSPLVPRLRLSGPAPTHACVDPTLWD